MLPDSLSRPLRPTRPSLPRGASAVRGLASALLLVLTAALLSALPLLPTPEARAAGNPIQTENAQPGSTAWQFDHDNTGNPLTATNHEIEGYASATSVNKGGSIDLMVNLSSNAQYTMQVFRMGYYPSGTGCSTTIPCGARLMTTLGPLAGAKQAACPTSTATATFGLTECSWPAVVSLPIPTTWTTGNYIVKVKRSDTGKQSYITFVVRDDAGPADIVLSMDVTTWQAYNFWGGSSNINNGYSLYGQFNDVTYNNTSNKRASAVSFNRPYLDQGAQDGAGNFMVWDYPMVRWLEKNGYNVTYATDLDIENNPGLLSGRKAFLNTGHDEYYSDNMRANIQGYLNGGAHLGWFSANNVYYRIRFGDATTGQAQRTIYCYKDALLDPQSPPTVRWRDLTPPKPENSLVGVLQNGAANDRAFRVADASSWIYAGTGLSTYTSGTPVTSGTGQNAIAGLIGYEFDERAANDKTLSSFASYEPAGLQQVGHSDVPASDNGVAAFSDATLYTVPSGGIVFAAGTLQWSWGLDNGFNDGFCDCNPGYANAKSQQITTNILNKFLTTTTAPAAVTLSPASLIFATQALNSSSPSQDVTLTNSGGAPLTISGLAITGTNSGDFSQTSTCPLSPTSLVAGASCRISVAFRPSAAGARSATVSVTDNAGGSPHTVALSGTGASAPAVTLSPASVTFGSEQVATSSPAQVVTLTNSGSAPLTISSQALTGNNPGDFTITTTCPVSPAALAAGGSCTTSVTFTPTAPGTRTASLTVSDDASSSPQSVGLAGTATTTPVPAVTLAPTSLTFPSQTVGSTSAASTVTVTNSGNAALTVSSIAITGANAVDFAQTNTCPSSLAAGASCTVNVTFTPSVSGSRTGTVTLADNAADSPQGVALTGTGASAGTYLSDGFESGTLSAWSVQASSGGSATVQSTSANSGTKTAALTTSSSGQYVGLAADLASGAHPSTYSRFCFRQSGLSGSTVLAQGRDVNGNNMWEVDYDAGSKGLDLYFWNGARTRTNLVSSSNLIVGGSWYCAEVQLNQATAGHAQVWLNGASIASTDTDLSATNAYSRMLLWLNGPAGTVNLDDVQVGSAYNGPVGAGAAGLPGPAVTLSPSSVTFVSQPVVTVSGTQTVTLTNSGSAPLTITGVTIGGTNAADFAQGNSCPLSPSTLAISGSCTISVTFTPSATGTRTATISVADNATGAPHIVALSGTGGAALAPTVTFSPASVGFGSLAVGSTSAASTVTLSNSGSAALTISSIALTGTNPGDFAQTSTCPISPATLAASSSCSISASFTPTAGGARSASISVSDNAASSPQSVSLSGTGSLPNGTFLTDGFENGLTLWSSLGNGVATIQTTSVNSGTEAVALTDSSSGQYTGLSAALSGGAQATSSSRFCFSLSGISGSTVLAQGRDASGNNLWEIDYDSPAKGFDVYLWNGARVRTNLVSKSGLLTVGSWYCAELQVQEAAAGSAQLFLNGTQIGSATGDLSVTNAYSRLVLWNNGATGTVNLDDVQVASTVSGPVGAGATPLPGPGVTLNPTSLSFPSQNVGTTSPAATNTLTNSGTTALTLSGMVVTGTNAGDFASSSTCPLSPSTLAAGASCTISVTFKPTASGTRTASVAVTDNATGSPHVLALSGTAAVAASPGVTLSPSAVGFGSQDVGTTSPASTLTLTSSGTAPLTLSAITLGGAAAGDFGQTNTCPVVPASLAVGSSCTVSVTFAPTRTGSRQGTLSFTDNAPDSPQVLSVSGTGTLPAGTYLSAGFDTALDPFLASGNGTATVTATANSGTGAAQLTTAAGQYEGIYADLSSPQASSYSRFCFSLSGLSRSTVLAQGRSATGGNLWEVDYDAARQGLDTYFWNGAGVRIDGYSPTGLLVPDKWYCAEVQTVEGTSGSAQVWLNGTPVIAVSGDLSTANPYSRLWLWNNGATGTVRMDDVRVSATYNGPVGAATTP